MSAAHRGGERIAADNYPTPPWCTRRILEALNGDRIVTPTIGDVRILEPCAGEGAIVHALFDWWPDNALGTPRVVGGDIRDVFDLPGATSYVWDATKSLGLQGPFDLLITNPPFSLAAEIITAQRDTARVSAYLLRSSFKLEGELKGYPLDENGREEGLVQRYSFRNDMPDVYQLPERPSFVASDRCIEGIAYDGVYRIACGWAEKVPLGTPKPTACPMCGGLVRRSTSDASEYAWFVWGPQRRSEGRLILLPSTPLAERKANT